MAYFAGNNVKDPLKSAYIANYAFIIMMAIPVAFLSIPFTKLVYTRFAIFENSLMKGMLVLVAWWLSFATFIITDPVFKLSKDNQGNDIERKVYWIMVVTACGLALAGGIGFVAAIQAPDNNGKAGNKSNATAGAAAGSVGSHPPIVEAAA
ncbi:hypothetical protein GGI05_002594 [Coemansia sp. RSA 2603]|nr:hypothetical protein GGI05_002594 [Coemansia sp. RSA 2603]